MRAPLTGGNATCPPIDKYYGRFDLAYPTLQPYLDNLPSPVYADGTFTGDEQGTQSNPFNTVYEATFCVRSNDRILIAAGTYPETFSITRPMTLSSQGGTVHIGQ